MVHMGRPAGEDEPSPDNGISPGERLDLRAALGKLPLQQRVAVVLFYLDDRPVAQVAKVMGISEGTANRHLFRAREALRGYLQ